MIRSCVRHLLLAGAAFTALATALLLAQEKPAAANALSPLEKQVQDSEAAWTKLAGTMEDRMSRLLPCDPAANRIIDEASKASESRMAALKLYMKARQDQSALAAGAAKLVLQEAKSRTGIGPQDRADTEQERAGIESRIANLEAVLEQKPALAAARNQLQQALSLVQERTLANNQAVNQERAMGLLEELATSLQARQASIGQEMAALQDEETRWKAYYAARKARATVECSVTGGGAGKAGK